MRKIQRTWRIDEDIDAWININTKSGKSKALFVNNCLREAMDRRESDFDEIMATLKKLSKTRS